MSQTHYLPNIVNGGSQKRTKLTVDSDQRDNTLVGFRNTLLSDSDIEFIASYISSIEYYPTLYANRHTGKGFTNELHLDGTDTLGVNYKLSDIAIPIKNSAGSIIPLITEDGEPYHFLDASGNLTGTYYDNNGNIIPEEAFAHSSFDNLLLAAVIQKQNEGVVFANAYGANELQYKEVNFTPVSLYGAPMFTVNVGAALATDTLASTLRSRIMTGFSAIHVLPRAIKLGDGEHNPAIASAIDLSIDIGGTTTIIDGNDTKIAFYQSDTDTTLHDTPLAIFIKWILPKLTVSPFPGGVQPRGQLYYLASEDHIVTRQSILFYPNDPEGIQHDIASMHRNVDVMTISTNTGAAGGNVIPTFFISDVADLSNTLNAGAPAYEEPFDLLDWSTWF